MSPDRNLPSNEVFHFDEGRPSFDDFAQENGFRYWSARRMMELLDYANWDSFCKVINKAIGVCMTIGAKVDENFVQCMTEVGGVQVHDYKLSRFACYLVAVNGDPKKRPVAMAQAYFAAIATQFQRAISGIEDVERVEIREQVSRHERSLNGIAQSKGIENYAFFQDAGYRGLYNMSLNELKRHRGFDTKGRPLLDFMGKRELAANLFRITETEARIKGGAVQGQDALEQTAKRVGGEVRSVMLQDGGQAPESLPLAPDILKIESDLKRTAKGLKKADS